MHVCMYVYMCGPVGVYVFAHIREVDIWYLSHSFSTLHTDQGCSLDLNSLTKLV